MSENFDCSISFDEVSGNVDLSERGEREKRDGYDSWGVIRLVDVGISDGHLTITHDKNGVEIAVSAHHVENENTARAFHAVLEIKLDRKEVAILRDFLDMVCKWQGQAK